MAGGYSPFPSTLDISERPRRRTETKEDQPPPLFYSGPRNTGSIDLVIPVRYPTTPGDPNLDPFYLERSLENVAAWESEKDNRDAGCDQLQNGKFTSSDLSLGTVSSVSSDNQERLPALAYQTPKLATHASFEHTRSPTSGAYPFPYHHGQNSFSSIQSDASGNTPDLTPSSSFSSSYSVSNCPQAVLNATKQLSLHTTRVDRTVSEPPSLYLNRDCISISDHIDSYASTGPPTPTGTITPYNFPYNNGSSDTLIMHFTNPPAPPASSLRSKPLPSLPNLSRDGSETHLPKKCHSPGFKSQIDPALISPPRLIDPVTLEPHVTAYDQAMFIPANDCPSPVPSPVASSPPITRRGTGHSTRPRPSTSTSEVHCEQSVWESDSDSESIGPKSLSRRRPIDTLRKVRSRVQLKVARSQSKLDGDDNSGHETDRTSEDLPPMPNNVSHQRFPEFKTPTNQNWTPEPVRGSVEHTLRLVAPSTISLSRPRSSRSNSQEATANMSTSTVAAMHAQSRRRHKSEGEQRHNLPTHQAIYGKCLDSQSTIDLNAALSLSRPGFLKRLCRSFRALSCHHVHDDDCYEKAFR